MPSKKSSVATEKPKASSKRSTPNKKVKNDPVPEPVKKTEKKVEENVEENKEKEVVETKDKIAVLISKAQAMQAGLKEFISELKTLQKEHNKLLKQSQRKNKNKESGQKRDPSGFAKPTEISDDLAKFLDVPLGTLLARTEVTKKINKYIKDNELQDPKDKRTILPDTKLRKILSYSDSDGELTYFNLQRFLKHHFKKETDVAN